jgi:hypothetical protein
MRALAERLRHLLRHEHVRPEDVEVTRTGRRLLELGAPAVTALVAAYREIDPHPVPPALLDELRAAPPGPAATAGPWPTFQRPVLRCRACTRAAVRHWVGSLGFLAGEEDLLAEPAVLKWVTSAQALLSAPLPYLVEAVEELPPGATRGALLWLLRWRHGPLLGPDAANRPEQEVLAALTAELRFNPLHWGDVEPAVLGAFAARGLVAPGVGQLKRLRPEEVVLSPQAQRSAELALLRFGDDGRWTWAQIRATLERHEAMRGTVDGARAALAKAGMLAPLPFATGEEAWVNTYQGAVAFQLADAFAWPFGPTERPRFDPALAESEPARGAAALHQALWVEGPTPELLAALHAMAASPRAEVRAALLEGLASRLEQTPTGDASDERPAGPDGRLLPAAAWAELVRARLAMALGEGAKA